MSIKHKDLYDLIVYGESRKFQPSVSIKLKSILSFLQDMNDEEALYTVKSWRAHKLTGDMKGTWSLFITRNWRLTFNIKNQHGKSVICDLNFEDYH